MYWWRTGCFCPQETYIWQSHLSQRIHQVYHLVHQKEKQIVCHKNEHVQGLDRVQWDYLISILRVLGFSTNWRQLIYNFISTTTISARINTALTMATLSPHVVSDRKPRFPTPLHYCPEGLTRLHRWGQHNSLIYGIRVTPMSPSISISCSLTIESHLFVKAGHSELVKLNCLLDTDQFASRQLVNKAKSNCVLSEGLS